MLAPLILAAGCSFSGGPESAPPDGVKAAAPAQEAPKRAKAKKQEPDKKSRPAEQETVSEPRKKREEVAEPRREESRQNDIVVENPPIEEDYLFESESMRLMVSDTVVPSEEKATPLFDSLGEEAKSAYVRAAYLNQTGYTTKALEYYLEAVEKDPENLWLKNRAARAALYHNNLSRASKLAEEVFAADEKNYQAMQVLAMINLARNNRSEAISWYSRILEIKPHNIDALENLARMSYEDQDYERTKEYCAKILEVTSRNLNAILWHAEASALTGDIAHAATLYEQLIRYRPMLISRVGDMGIRLLRQGRADDAERLYRHGVAIQPTNEILRLQWEALLRETKGEEAVHEAYRELAGEHPLDLQIQEVLARFLERQDATDELVAQRKKMLEINPRHVESLISLAGVELSQGNTEAANGYFERAIKAGPRHASTYRDIALTYIDQERYDRAEELLREALAIDPEDADVYTALALLAEQRGNPSQVERYLKDAIDRSPANEKILAILAEFYYKNERFEEASQIYEQILVITPDDADATLRLAGVYFKMGADRMLDNLQKKLASSDWNSARIYSDYGIMAMRQGAWDRARWGLEKALREFPGNIGLRQALATVYLRMNEPVLAEQVIKDGEETFLGMEGGLREYRLTLMSHYTQARQHEKALEIVEKLVAENPEDLDLRGIYLETLVELGRHDTAIEELNEVVRDFAADNPQYVKKIRAQVYRNMGEYQRAIGVLNGMETETLEQRRDVYFDLALTYGDMGDVDNAERYYQRLIDDLSTEGDDFWIAVNSRNNLAYLYANHETKLERAEELAREALSLNPDADYILDTIGWIRLKRGDFEEAEEYLKRAERLALPDPEIYEHLGDLYRLTGREVLATEYYERALEIDPEAEGVREKLDMTATALREPATNPATP